MIGRYKLVTFDATNTLLKFRIPPVEQYAKAGKLYGISVDQTKLKESFKHQWKELSAKHPNFGSSTGLTSSEWWTKFVKMTFTGAGCLADNTKLSDVAAHLIKVFGTQECWETYPFSQELLQKLKQRGLTLGVISNFDERLENILVEVGIRNWFDFVIISYKVNCAKPDIQIFQLALKQKVGIRSQEAIHIGDNVELDYKAARNAGWDSVLLQREQSKISEEIDSQFVVSNLKDVTNIILNDK